MKKQKTKLNKKGELTTQQLVMIIILIISFAVILFLIFRLNLGRTTNSEICHDSVVKKSNPVLALLSGELKCKTDYVCISGGEKCSGIVASSTVNVDANKKEEILKAIAEKMADCWWMFGEGKLDYTGGGGVAGTTACAICSIIEFDDKIKSAFKDGITYKEFIDSLNTPMKLGEAETYLGYIYGFNNLNSVLEEYPTSLKADYLDTTRKISLEGKYMIRTGIAKTGAAGFIRKIFTGDKPFYHIVPYLFKTDEIPDPQCNEFITQS